MATISLINNTGAASIYGYGVKYDPVNPLLFVYAADDDVDIIGVVGQWGIPNSKSCKIYTDGTTTSVAIYGNAEIGQMVRSRKVGDGGVSGQLIAENYPIPPYQQIGEVLSFKNGFAKVKIALKVVTGGGSGSGNGYFPMGWN